MACPVRKKNFLVFDRSMDTSLRDCTSVQSSANRHAHKFEGHSRRNVVHRTDVRKVTLSSTGRTQVKDNISSSQSTSTSHLVPPLSSRKSIQSQLHYDEIQSLGQFD